MRRLALSIIFWAALAGQALPLWQSAAYGAESDIRLRQGQEIYRRGQTSATPAITVRLREGDASYPARNFRCANCHGSAGQGGREAGLRAPAIDAKSLARPIIPQGERHARPAYDRDTLKRVIASGIDAAGAPLGAGMPRYRMSDAQLDTLIDYVQVLGTFDDNDPGIDRDSIKLGAALPLTGPMAAMGKDVAALLKARFDLVNGAGGIYGRRLILVIADCGNSDEEIRTVTRQLVTDQEVFALVASFQPVDHDALDAWLADTQVPLVGPVGQAAHEITPKDAPIWQLLPTLNDQARVLVDYVMSLPTPTGVDTPRRIAIIRAETPGAADAATGATAQLTQYGASVITLQIAGSDASTATEVARLTEKEKPEHILFFGGSRQLQAFAAALYAGDGNAAPIGALALLGAARDMPEIPADKLVWAYPGEPTDEAQWSSLMNKGAGDDYSANSSAFQAVAFAAVAVLQESLMRAGRRLSRDSLTRELDGLHGFESGVLPPLEFRGDNRIGSRGASIVQFDSGKARYIAKWSWRSPSTAFRGVGLGAAAKKASDN